MSGLGMPLAHKRYDYERNLPMQVRFKMVIALTTLFDTLLSELDEEIILYQTMLRFVEDERDVLIRSKLSELLSNNAAKENLVRQVLMLRRARKGILAELALRLRVPVRTATLSFLMEKADSERRGKLEICQKELGILIRRIKNRNAINRRIAESSEEYVSKWQSFLLGMCNPFQGYVHTGQMKAKQLYGTLLNDIG